MRVQTTLFVVAGLLACSSDPNNGSSPGRTMDPYTGPQARCELEVMESAPPQYAVKVSVSVPTGGYAFEPDGVEVDGEVTVVKLKLTGPGPDETVTQAFVDHEVRVPIDAPKTVEVRIAEWVRGVSPSSPPPHRLVQTLTRR